MKQLARVPHVLWRDSRADRLAALEARAGVERLTLHARPEVHATALALALERDLLADRVPAPRAADHLGEPRHPGDAEIARVSRTAFFLRLLRLRTARLTRFILIPTLAIFALRHRLLHGPDEDALPPIHHGEQRLAVGAVGEA